MKLEKKLSHKDGALPLISDDVQLELLSPGRARFEVKSKTPISGIVTLDFGYGVDAPQRYFTGYIERDSVIDDDRRMLFCRELTAALNRALPLALRHPSARDVLTAITAASGVEFVTPDRDYIKQRAPNFYTWGGGYHAMDAIGRVFDIANYIWQQQGDGRVFVGSWDHSFWADKPVDVPQNLLTKPREDGATLPAVPQLRPGVRFNGKIITALNFTGTEMNVTWSDDPWSMRLKN